MNFLRIAKTYLAIVSFFLLNKNHLEKNCNSGKPSPLQKTHMGTIFPSKIRLESWPKHGKKNTKLAILKGLSWKHIGPERKPPRKTTFVIWDYDYGFVRGKKWYMQVSGCFLLFTNPKNRLIFFFVNLHCIRYFFWPDAVQNRALSRSEW